MLQYPGALCFSNVLFDAIHFTNMATGYLQC